mgnify:CR=1 FL=1
MNTIEEIQKLKKEKNAVILAHYYVDGEVQAIADYVGDSYYLSKLATTLSEDTIIFCGVNFMGESAKLLNPKKKVIMADEYADCPMAHMVDIDTIEQVRQENPDVCVVCYVNSTAQIKAHSDVCVTSSNAVFHNLRSFLFRTITLVIMLPHSFLKKHLFSMMVSVMYIKAFI